MKSGALRQYMKNKYGNSAFDKNGNLKIAMLKEALKNADLKIKRRIIFALNMRKKWKLHIFS